MKAGLLSLRELKRRGNLKRRLHEETVQLYSAKPSKIAARPAAARNDEGAALQDDTVCHFLNKKA
jgi:hypothetical protein